MKWLELPQILWLIIPVVAGLLTGAILAFFAYKRNQAKRLELSSDSILFSSPSWLTYCVLGVFIVCAIALIFSLNFFYSPYPKDIPIGSPSSTYVLYVHGENDKSFVCVDVRLAASPRDAALAVLQETLVPRDMKIAPTIESEEMVIDIVDNYYEAKYLEILSTFRLVE